jgi:hypothetical protein
MSLVDIQGADSFDLDSIAGDFDDDMAAAGLFSEIGADMLIGADPVAQLLAAASGYGGGYSGDAMSLIGAARRGNPAAQRALVQRARQLQAQRQAAGRNVRAAVAQSAARTPNAAVLREQQPTKARRYPLGFVQLAIAAGATATINAQPQVTFRPERFVVPRLVAPSFLINQIVIGKNPQLVAVGQVPADAFTEDSVETGLGLDTANVGQLISLQVQNATAAVADFRAVMIGPVIE